MSSDPHITPEVPETPDDPEQTAPGPDTPGHEPDVGPPETTEPMNLPH